MTGELETLKWANWAAQQRFDAQPPEAKAKLVEMYSTNVLPYVAQATGQDTEQLRSMFAAKYPEVARMGGLYAPASPTMPPGPLSVQPVLPGASQMGSSGMTPEEEQAYLTTGKLPTPRAAKPDQFEERRRQVEALKASGGLEGVDPRAIETFLLTGKADGMSPEPDPIARQRTEREQYLAYIDQQFPNTVTPKQRMAYMLTGDAKALLEEPAPTNEFEQRKIQLQRIEEMFPEYVTDEMRRAYVITGDKSVFNTGGKDTEMAQRRAYLAEVEAQFPGVFDDRQKAEYMVTGDKKAFQASKPADAKAEREVAEADARLLRSLELSLSNTDSTLRAASKLIELTGGDFDPETGESSYSGRSLFGSGEMPVAGPFSKRLANSGTLTFDANSARGYLKTLKASAVFKTLQDLRAASENGSSGLGQVTNVEIDLLGSRIAALDIDNLTDEELYNEVLYFAQELVQARSDIEKRLEAEKTLQAERASQTGATSTPPAPGAATGGGAGSQSVSVVPAPAQATTPAPGGQSEPIEIPQDVWDEIIGGGN